MVVRASCQAKSLSASWDIEKSHVDEEDDEKTDKALEAGGSPLVPESLEGDKKKEETTSKSLTFDESVTYLMDEQGLTKSNADFVTKFVFKSNGELL